MVNRRVSVAVDADLNAYNRGVLSGVASTRAWVRELESADSRLSGIVQTGLALAPALTPLAAAAVGPIAGMTTQLGFLGVAAGTTMLAFNGVGDALDALNDYQLNQTPKNLEKLNEKLDALGPAGEVFVRRLQDARGALQDLQDVAQEDMLPGVSEGIDSALTQMPRLERVVSSVASAVGELFEDAGSDLAGPEWSEFFEYLEREAGPIIEASGKSIGNLVEGMTNLVMALDPLSDDWTAGLLKSSESFVAWSDSLDSSEGFQKFVSYVQESGPEALDTLGSIASMLLEFAEAAAPVGDVVLPVLGSLADVLGEVADSPVGPILIAAAAGVGALGRSLALLSAVGLRGNGDSVLGRVFATDKIKAGLAAFNQVPQSLYNITTASERAAMSETQLAAAKERQTAAEQKRTAAMKAGATQLAKTAAAGAGLAIATSGIADGLGLSNTATLGLMGTLGGPWGVAIGAATGAVMDFAAANDVATDMQNQMSAAVRAAGADFEARDAAVQAGAERLRNYWEQQTLLGQAWEGWDKLITGESSYDQAIDDWRAAEADRMADQFDVIPIATAFGMEGSLNFEDLTRAAERARPAMEALNIGFDDLADMDSSELRAAAEAIADWTAKADSSQSRTRAAADAFRALDDQMVDTATAAEMVEASLDALLGPSMNLSAANDQWVASLRSLKDELSDNGRALKGNSDAALENRAAVRDRVNDMRDVLVAEANAGASAKELSGRLRNQRDALLDAGEAAGLSRRELRNYLDELGLTPKLVKTLIKAETREAMANINGFKFRWDQIRDKTVYLRTVETRTGPGGQGNGYDPSARGNIFPSVRSYAMGDLANRHQPELAGPGVTRVWREPETMGEAYVPLANDDRRPRAKRILEDTASIFGGQVMWFASGGTTGSKNKDTKKGKRTFEGEFTESFIPGINAWVSAQHSATETLLVAASDQAAAARNQLEAAEAAAEAAQEQKEAAENQLRATEAQREAFASQVRGNFERDPFGSGFNAAVRSLTKDAKGAAGFEDLLRQLELLGLDGDAFGALAASGDAATARGMLARGVDGVNTFESAYGAREAALGSLSGYTADQQFADVIAAQTAQLAAATAMQDQAAARVAELSGSVWALGENVTALQNQLGALTEAMVNRSDRPINVVEARNARDTAREISRNERAGV